MNWLQDLAERIINFFNAASDNECQRMRKNVGLKQLRRFEGILNFMIIIVLAFFTFVVIGLLGYFGFI